MPNQQNTEKFLDDIYDAVNFQVDNGLLTDLQSTALHQTIKDARIQLPTDLIEADRLAGVAWATFSQIINTAKLKEKLFTLYGIHVWIFLGSVGVLSILSIVYGWLNFPIQSDISANVTSWACLGGTAYSIFHLRKNIYQRQLSKYYSIYWTVYPFAGVLFGLVTVFLLNAGLLQIKVTINPSVYVIVAFLGGMFQQWAIGTLKDIAYSIHKPS